MADNVIANTRRLLGFGSGTSGAYDLFFGHTYRGQGDTVETNLDHQGMVFFVRPMLNLTTENISRLRARKLHYLTDQNEASLAALVRSTLFPKKISEKYEPNLLRSAAVDEKQAFIPFLSNTLVSLTGWPDYFVEFLESKEGWWKQTHSHVDSHPENYTSFDLTATFTNKEGDPHLTLFSAWLYYMQSVAVGTMVPLPEMIAQREIDYNTKVFILVMDSTKTYIQKIATVGAMTPKNVPYGAAFNYVSEKTFNDENAQIDIPFKAHGAIYNDPETITAFNATVVFFNKDMHDDYRDMKHKKLSPREKIVFYNKGYPRINPETFELEWWVDFETYNQVLGVVGGEIDDDAL